MQGTRKQIQITPLETNLRILNEAFFVISARDVTGHLDQLANSTARTFNQLYYILILIYSNFLNSK